MGTPQPCLLVIDDDDLVRSVLRRLLGRHGFTIIDAADSREGVRLAVLEKPNLILLDGSLPDVDGYKVLAWLKTMPETKDIPIVVCSGSISAADRRAAMDLGADDYIEKPFDATMLLNRIQLGLAIGQKSGVVRKASTVGGEDKTQAPSRRSRQQ